MDRALQVIELNRTLRGLAGGPPDAHPPLPLPIEHALPAWAPALTPFIHDVLATGVPVENVALPATFLVGGEHTHIASFYPVRSQFGAVLGVDLVVSRRGSPAEATSLLPMHEVALALDTMPVGVLLLDGAALRVHWANATYQTFLDAPFNQGILRGHTLDEFIPYAEESGVAGIFRQVAATGEAYTNPEHRHEGFARGVTYWRWSLLPIRNDAPPYDLLLVVTEITEQVQLRQAADALADELTRERAQLDTLIAQLPVGLLIAEAPSRRLLLQNDQAVVILDQTLLTAEGMADDQRYEALRADGRPYAPEEYPLIRALEGDVVQSELLTYRRGDGRLTHLEVSAAPVRDAAGQVVLAVSTFQDVSAREQAAEALRLSEARFRAMQEASIDGFMLLESVRDERGAIVDFRWLHANGAAERIVGRPQSWFPGRQLLEEMPGNRAEGLFDAYVRVVETGEPWSTEIAYAHEGVNAYMRLVAARAGDGFAITFADLSERRRAEEHLRESEERFRSVFESIDEGFCIVECLFDGEGRPMDYRFLQANPAFERQTGLLGAVGHTARELVPELEPFWFETYGRVALTGEGVRFESHVAPMGRWFDVYASRVGDASSRRVAIVFADITERKQAEAALAARATQDAYRLRLADALRPLLDVKEIEDVATRVLGEGLGAARATYFTVQGGDYVIASDYTAGVASIQGRFPMASFGPDLLAAYHAGRTVVVPDVSADASLTPAEREAYQLLDIVAHVGVPLVKDGRFAAGLAVHMAVPRVWTVDEVALIEETAERTWVAMDLARTERARRESETRLQLVLDASAMGSFVWNVAEDHGEPDGRLLAHFGLPPDSTISLAQALAELLHPDDGAHYAEAVRRAVDPAGDGRLRVEIRTIQPDGSVRWLAITGQTFFTGSPPRPTRMAGVSADITERKHAEVQLAAAAARDQYRLRLADALRSLSDARAIQGAATRVLGEQLGASRVAYFEVEGDDYVVQHDFTLGVPSIIGRFPIAPFGPRLLAAYTSGRTLVEPAVPVDTALTPAEHAAYAALNIAAYVGAPLVKDGRLVGGLTVHMALPHAWTHEEIALIEETAERTWAAVERASAEMRLHELYAQEQAARQAAEEASRLKDEFLATVSHELRTPLTALLGYAELLQRRRRDEAYIARTLPKMVQSARTQAQLIEDLLDISRIVSGKLKLTPEPVHLAEVIVAALDTVRPMLDAKRIRLDLDLSPVVETVMGDPHRLLQVLWNLLSNAGKFTPVGGAVSVRLEQDEQHVSVTVSDTGQGIAPDFLPFVFDRFRQADGTSQRSHGGLGLGLAIVRHLVELHGGMVTVTSAGLGQGTTFTVRLPLTGQFVAQGDAAEAERDGTARELAGLRVLIVDDQPAILEVLAELLATDGATVQVCTSADEALAALRADPPDVLISDIAMPGWDGYWLIEQVRRLPPEDGGAVPAIALTAYVQLEDRLRVLAAGYQQYVPKPVDSAELRDVIVALTTPDETGVIA